MNPIPAAVEQARANAESELARLTGRVEAMRTVLIRLLQDVVQAETRLEQGDAAMLVQANQNLVVAALLSQADADTAAGALDEAARASELDALTQLPNRALLLDRFAQAAANANRHGTRLALLFLDLDNFKQINDNGGHATGDAMLRLVAQRLQATVRAGDTVSRHGGDEFLVLLGEVTQRDDATVIADKLIAALAAPSGIDAAPEALNVSIGISLYPDDGADVATLIAHADAAMYRVKRNGGGGWAFHGPAAPADGGGAAAGRQATLREANEQLLLAALGARELQAAAEQALQRQSAFMAAVVDELRNPMAPIRIATAMLGLDEEPLRKRVDEVVAQHVAAVARMVGDVLDAEAVGPAALVLERRVVDMAVVIGSAIAACRPLMQARRQRFEARLPAGTLPVNGDPDRLAQVVGNLLDNASRHTPDGGRITLGVDVVSDAMTLTLTVADDGIGIEPQMLPHVFDPFVQDTPAIGLRGGGPGIGLTAARALVEAHGGSIVAHSAGGGQGSRFVVTLALHPPDAATLG